MEGHLEEHIEKNTYIEVIYTKSGYIHRKNIYKRGIYREDIYIEKT